MWILAAAVLGLAVPAGAQRQRAQRPMAARPPAAGERLPDSAGRARLERELRRGFARAVRNRVGLSEEQMARLVPITQRYEQQRRQLQMEERDARVALRTAMRDDATADASQIDALLRKLVDVQQRRAHILGAEQVELATIMTPLQRARYMALQDQIRRRLEQMRQRRMPPE